MRLRENRLLDGATRLFSIEEAGRCLKRSRKSGERRPEKCIDNTPKQRKTRHGRLMCPE